MKTVLAVLAILSAVPTSALAQNALNAREAMYAYWANRIKEHNASVDEKQTAIKARCAKLGGARIGMTAVQVRASCWGKPDRVNDTLTARGENSQWVYRGGYVYLTDGVVTAIQTSGK